MKVNPNGLAGKGGSSNWLFLFIKNTIWMVLVFLLSIAFGQSPLSAAKPPTDKEEVFVKLLEKAYSASCGDADLLREYYLADAEIIHDGRQMTLDEIIKELKQSVASLTGLACGYRPQVKSSHVDEKFAYFVVRESISLEADEIGRKEINQICTYIFSRTGSGWKISHDHCSSVPGITT